MPTRGSDFTSRGVLKDGAQVVHLDRPRAEALVAGLHESDFEIRFDAQSEDGGNRVFLRATLDEPGDDVEDAHGAGLPATAPKSVERLVNEIAHLGMTENEGVTTSFRHEIP